MCLHPLQIRNPTKVIHNKGGQLLRMQVPCGHCAQCLQAKRNEWYIRTHYEVLHTFSKGGYVYFDTLTYADDHIPRLSHFLDIAKYNVRDFTCFNHSHFKLFLKRLRRMISHRYKIKSDAFRYFLTTEYGEDERYTHRPHYHILFFVYVDIPPLEFSQMVADCWQYGRTDGYPFKPATYVYKHIYGRDMGYGSNTDFSTITSVCMYVSKYITKSSKFAKKLNGRLAHLREQFVKYNSLHKRVFDDDAEEMLKQLKRNIDMFHRQSKGFGISYIHDLTPDKLMFLEHDKVIMQDKEKVVKTYPLPMYYKRKLYYSLEEHADGTKYWQPTDLGKQHIIANKLRCVDAFALKYMDIVRNCKDDNLIRKFFEYLGPREITDYVIYELFYRGRHRDINSINYLNQQTTPLTDEEFNLYDWVARISDALCPYASNCNTLSLDETLLRTPFLSQEQINQRDEECAKNGHGQHMFNNSRSDTIGNYIQQYTFNENSDVYFEHYDKLAVVIQQMTEAQRDDAQITFDYLEDLKERYKLIFNKLL